MPRLFLVLALVFGMSASPPTKPAAATKAVHVALVGDSLAYGAGDEEGKGIAGRLAPELKTRGLANVVTTNLGVNGSTTDEVGSRLKVATTRTALKSADAIVLSMGANDVRKAFVRERSFSLPIEIVDEVLENMEAAVAELHRINPSARIFILGAYAPVPHERTAILLEPLVALWDATLVGRFANDPLVEVIRMSDIVDGPERLSELDSFHPGGQAYQETAARIAERLAAIRD